ncbi:MAG: hypothetical protein H6942_13200 [Candidatus Accumulibacter sp.]|uniref:hypothetical protein n=1 Tax=Accumulibacter sp. TaxID=2053492 RepID=UPI0019DCF41B|nr:hypothetical protein [Accumulibacter sp.]MBE2259700.1 hypothetical protein [Paracoccaceae bacterium]MCP5249469.1 hypothetical protein [Accumulibacter sp.]
MRVGGFLRVVAMAFATAALADDSPSAVPIPRTLEEAAAQRDRAELMRAQAEQRYQAEQDQCYGKFLVSGCLVDAKKRYTASIVEARKLDQPARDFERAAHRQEVEAREAQRAAERLARQAENQENAESFRAEQAAKVAERDAKLAAKARKAEEGRRKTAAEQARRQAKLEQRAQADARREATKAAREAGRNASAAGGQGGGQEGGQGAATAGN